MQRTNVVEFARDTEKNAMSNEKKDKMMQDGVSRRSVLGMGSAALAAAAFVGLSAHAKRAKVRIRQNATIPRVTLDRRSSHFWTRIPTQTHLRRRLREMSVPFGTPMI